MRIKAFESMCPNLMLKTYLKKGKINPQGFSW